MTIKNLKPRFPKIKYISIGDGEEMQSLQNLKNELGLGNEVLLLNESTELLKVALLLFQMGVTLNGTHLNSI